MLILRKSATALVAACLASAGCCASLTCGDNCPTPSPYAFMKYDCTCETCGPGWCGGASGCGANVACGDACTCGDGCAEGTCAGGAYPGGCAGGACRSACGGCQCGKPSPCWALNLFCRCTGCGELYWNEWYNDPPACAEPCDCYGNWTGPGQPGFYRAPYRMHDVYVAEAAPLAEAESGGARRWRAGGDAV